MFFHSVDVYETNLPENFMKQTSPTGVFLKHFGIFQSNCSKEYLRANASIYRKTPVLESFFKKVTESDSTSATSKEQILQRVTSDFLQRATSAASNERILQPVTSDFLQ